MARKSKKVVVSRLEQGIKLEGSFFVVRSTRGKVVGKYLRYNDAVQRRKQVMMGYVR